MVDGFGVVELIRSFRSCQAGKSLRTAACLILLAVVPLFASCSHFKAAAKPERIRVAPDQRGFVLKDDRFIPWGVNYGNNGRLMEDFWSEEWATLADDFREIRALGGNVVRVHLQFGKFMHGPKEPNRSALKHLRRLLRLAEETRLYLDITGLACYRPADVPAWYDALDDDARWDAQAVFWRAVAAECASSPAVFCYDLMNEPITPEKATKWYSGNLFGEYDFIQNIARNPTGRNRHLMAVQWIQQMSAAIRAHDSQALITVGMLPWVTDWKHLSGFVPRDISPFVDFISIHLYPKTRLPEEARIGLQECAVGKPVVIEETFALDCTTPELEQFLIESQSIACGWIWHYDGITLAEYDALDQSGKLAIPQSVWRDNLQSFQRLRPVLTKGN